MKEDGGGGEGDVTGQREMGKRDGLMVFVKRMRDSRWRGGVGMVWGGKEV